MDNKYEPAHRPTEIRLKKEEKILEVDFNNGKKLKALPQKFKGTGLQIKKL
jgi:DUF971 family protein